VRLPLVISAGFTLLHIFVNYVPRIEINVEVLSCIFAHPSNIEFLMYSVVYVGSSPTLGRNISANAILRLVKY
jgi:hypothetical protein